VLQEISAIENLDKNSAAYRKRCYEIASKLNFFDMPHPTPESESLRKEYKNGEFYKNIRNANSPIKFYQNEPLNNLDNTAILKEIKRKGFPFLQYMEKMTEYSLKSNWLILKILLEREFQTDR
jgi:proline iminopeptidase